MTRFPTSLFLVLIVSSVHAETAVKRERIGKPFVRMPVHTERFFPRSVDDHANLYAGAGHDWSGVGRSIQGNYQHVTTDCSKWGTRISKTYAVTVGHNVAPGSHRLLFDRDDHNGKFDTPEMPSILQYHLRTNGISSDDLFDFALIRLDGTNWFATSVHASYPIYVHDFGSNSNNNVGENPNARDVVFLGIGSDGTSTSCRDPYHQKVARSRLVRLANDTGRNAVAIYSHAAINGTAESGEDHGMPVHNDSGSPWFYIHPQAGPSLVALSRRGYGTTQQIPTTFVQERKQSQVGLYKDDIVQELDSIQIAVPVQDREHVIFVTDTIGDLDGDHALTANDITILTREIYARVHRSPVIVRPKNWALDQNGDGVINDTDTTAWCNTFGTTIGDATLDGVVNFNDQTVVSASIANGGSGYGWGDGDFNGDGLVNQTDQDLLDQYFQGN